MRTVKFEARYRAIIIVAAVVILVAMGCNSVRSTSTPESKPDSISSASPAESPSSAAGPAAMLQLPDIAGVVEMTRPAVVSVVGNAPGRDYLGRVVPNPQSGSGVIFDPKGYILTNNHIVENTDAITVTLDDGRQFEAEALGTDRLTDLAVLKIDGSEFPAVPLADPTKVRVGEWVIAIGNALGLNGGPTVTVGVVSALDREFSVSADSQLYGLVQTDASINPGNSGGPLLNLRGEVVGINTAVARVDRIGRGIEGIGFAVGMDTVAPVAQQLIENGEVRWAWLGVLISELDPEMAAQAGVGDREGVLIVDVVRGGPAMKAGLRAGDVLLSVEGHEVATTRDLIELLRYEHGVGDEIGLVVARSGKEITMKATLEERMPM